jgi:hypothetical protein
VAHSRHGAILEQELPAPDRVALGNVQPRAQAMIIVTEKSDPCHSR